MTLYELTGELLDLLELAEDPDTDPEALEGSLESVSELFEDKADGYAKIIRQLNAEADMVDEEIKRLKAKRDSLKKNAERIKQILQAAMIATEKRKFKTPFFTFSIRKNPASVVFDCIRNNTVIPERFMRYKAPEVDMTAVKKEIKKAIEAGEDLSDIAHLESTESLIIK
jgi:Mg2+ and Co2+ transporter CorA